MNNRKRNVLILLSVLIIIIASLIVVLFVKRNQPIDVEPEKIIVLDSIDEYSYTLEERDTALFKNKFNELKIILEEEEINFEEYSKLLSQLYIIDLYTISNKINKYDVGSLEFVHPDIKENFSLNVQETLYKYVEDNEKKNRNQVLPEVLSIEVTNSEASIYNINNIEYESYIISLKWDYVQNLEYDTEAILTLIKKDNFMYIVEQM